jgi:hypothetical protein
VCDSETVKSARVISSSLARLAVRPRGISRLVLLAIRARLGQPPVFTADSAARSSRPGGVSPQRDRVRFGLLPCVGAAVEAIGPDKTIKPDRISMSPVCAILNECAHYVLPLPRCWV